MMKLDNFLLIKIYVRGKLILDYKGLLNVVIYYFVFVRFIFVGLDVFIGM